MRVLLINANRRHDLFAAPPVGICYVATAAESAGHDVQVYDLCFETNADAALSRAVSACQPEVVGISIRNVDNVNMLYPVSYLPEAKEVVGRIRALTGVPLVLGGSGASLMPEHVLRFLDADYIVAGDGEASFINLLAAFEGGDEANDVPGVGFVRDGTFRFTRPQVPDHSPWSPNLGRWIDMVPYQRVGGSYCVQTKRGCRHSCIYCTYNQLIEGRGIRLRPPKEVVDEIEDALFRYAPETFEFVDSVFNDPLDHCAEVLEEIAARPWKARFTAMGVSPKGLDRGFLRLMRRAGFTYFWMSPESASSVMLEAYRKGFGVDALHSAAEAIKTTNFSVLWSFLIGGPGETNNTVKETFDFVLKYMSDSSGPSFNMASYFVGVRVYPDTVLWRRAEEERFVTSADNPLQQLWYLSEQLDLTLLAKQMSDASVACPNMMSGFDERYLYLSRLLATAAKVFRTPKPYWRVICRINDLIIKSGLHFLFKPPDIVPSLQEQLRRQGYSGPLLG
ncbi:MAG: radical SAM protein [Pseudomonadota bacterium]